MSDTPRTDAKAKIEVITEAMNYETVDADFARQLERELQEAQFKLSEYEKLSLAATSALSEEMQKREKDKSFWKLVPRNPTRHMLDAWHKAYIDGGDVRKDGTVDPDTAAYHAMLDAAPSCKLEHI